GVGECSLAPRARSRPGIEHLTGLDELRRQVLGKDLVQSREGGTLGRRYGGFQEGVAASRSGQEAAGEELVDIGPRRRTGAIALGQRAQDIALAPGDGGSEWTLGRGEGTELAPTQASGQVRYVSEQSRRKWVVVRRSGRGLRAGRSALSPRGDTLLLLLTA